MGSGLTGEISRAGGEPPGNASPGEGHCRVKGGGEVRMDTALLPSKARAEKRNQLWFEGFEQVPRNEGWQEI